MPSFLSDWSNFYYGRIANEKEKLTFNDMRLANVLLILIYFWGKFVNKDIDNNKDPAVLKSQLTCVPCMTI